MATDVKVAPGGTENVDPEIYEAVVSQAIEEPQVSEEEEPQVFLALVSSPAEGDSGPRSPDQFTFTQTFFLLS